MFCDILTSLLNTDLNAAIVLFFSGRKGIPFFLICQMFLPTFDSFFTFKNSYTDNQWFKKVNINVKNTDNSE